MWETRCGRGTGSGPRARSRRPTPTTNNAEPAEAAKSHHSLRVPRVLGSTVVVLKNKNHGGSETQRKILLCVSVSPWLICSVCSAVSVRSCLERIAEHDLGDPHEPGLHADLTEVRVADRGPVRPDVDAIEQVEHLDLDLRGLCPEPQVLDEDTVDVGLHRRAQISDRPGCVPEGETRCRREGRWVPPGRRRMVGRGQPIL